MVREDLIVSAVSITKPISTHSANQRRSLVRRYSPRGHDVHANHRLVLQDPSVANAPVENRIAFLQSKNLTQEEIDVSLARAAEDAGHPSPAPQGAPPSNHAYRPQGSPPAYGNYPPPGYWQQPPPPEYEHHAPAQSATRSSQKLTFTDRQSATGATTSSWPPSWAA